LEELREEIGRRKVIRDEQFRIAQGVSLRVLQIRKQIQELRGGFKFGGAWGPWEQGHPEQLPAADAIPSDYKEASKKLDRSFGRLEHAMIKAEILFDVETIRASRHRLMGLAQEFFGGISSFAYAKREHALGHMSDSEYQEESARLRPTLIVPLSPRDRNSFQERIDREVSVIQAELRKYLSTGPPAGQLTA
jgi:hypothetical protein